MTLGDNHVPVDQYSRWYGFNNGKLKVGSRSDFGDEDIITPVVNHDYVISGNIDDNFDLGGLKDNFILYTENGENAVGYHASDNRKAINEYVKRFNISESNPAHIIQLDGGRYTRNPTKDPNEYKNADRLRVGKRLWV